MSEDYYRLKAEKDRLVALGQARLPPAVCEALEVFANCVVTDEQEEAHHVLCQYVGSLRKCRRCIAELEHTNERLIGALKEAAPWLSAGISDPAVCSECRTAFEGCISILHRCGYKT